MENDPQLSSDEARRALDAVTDAKKPLADHFSSPIWLHVVVGAATAGLVVGIALSKDHLWGSAIVAAVVVVLALLPTALRSRSRMSIDAFSHTFNRRIVAVYFFVLIALAGVALNVSHLAWALTGLGVAAFIWTAAVGIVVEKRLARAFRDGL